MNSYETKQKARRKRFEVKAEKAGQASSAAYEASRRATNGIVIGQPILVGHHSEKQHRAALALSEQAMRKCWEEDEKAKHYAQKAASVGAGGISSDDPSAIEKLRSKLADIEDNQVRMKAANKAIRSSKTSAEQISALVDLGFTEAQAVELIGCFGFQPFTLSNNNANASRIKKRIAALEARRSREAVAVEADGYRYREDTEENRVLFEFDGKPASEVRAVLKRHAFKWSPTRGAWVRQLTGSGIYAGQLVRAALTSAKGNAM